MDDVRVRLLGPIRLIDDVPTVPLPAKLAQLLAVLAVQVGRSLSVDEIAANMWPDPPPTHRELVRQYIASLRRRLPEGHDMAVQTELGSYTLDIAVESIDLWHLEEASVACERASAARDWAEAVRQASRMEAMWAGRPFHGAHFVTAPLLESEAVRVDELRHRGLELLALALAEHGETTLAIARLKAQIVESPIREPAYLHLMRILTQVGRTAEAVVVFEQLERTLHHRIGLCPGPETRQLFGQIRLHAHEG